MFRLVQAAYDVAACLGLQLALQQIFFSGEVWLEVGELLQGALVVLAACLVNLLVVHAFFRVRAAAGPCMRRRGLRLRI